MELVAFDVFEVDWLVVRALKWRRDVVRELAGLGYLNHARGDVFTISRGGQPCGVHLGPSCLIDDFTFRVESIACADALVSIELAVRQLDLMINAKLLEVPVPATNDSRAVSDVGILEH